MTLIVPLPGLTAEEPTPSGSWKRSASVPDSHGWAGMLAGESHGMLLAGGGAHFPAAPPWEGGAKVWSDRLFILTSPSGAWRELPQRLPFALGYSVVGSHHNRLIVAGGETPLPNGNGTRCCQETFSLEVSGDGVRIDVLPSLPIPLSNACGVVLDGALYLVGGIRSPLAIAAEKGLYRLDLSAPSSRWEVLPPIPGAGRMLSVSAASKGNLYVFGGVSLSTDSTGKPVRTPLRDCYRFNGNHGWTRLTDLPRAVTAAPSPAAAVNEDIIIWGGDDGTQMHQHPSLHSGFSTRTLVYSTARNHWTSGGEIPSPRVTVPNVEWQGRWYVVSGERRPGVRSPEVWSWAPNAAQERP
ncbi:hypothetical protein [Planctomicrobium sp. SH664]|uniref:hypothetical protein n=1 Tax=Planctomicrobium sp. SH664 TaxID=3448125 RepID=UPI003F5BC061